MAQGEAGANFAAFLAALAVRLPAGQTPLPPLDDREVREVGRDIDLRARYVEQARSMGLLAEGVTATGLVARVVEILERHAARRVLLSGDLEPVGVGAADLRARLAAAGISSAVEPLTVADMFAMDAAVTVVSAAVAETGSLVVSGAAPSSRLATLAPAVHIAVVKFDQIVPDLWDAFSMLPAALPSNVNLVSGPSKTADIEGVLVTGVHGPEFVYVLIL